MKKRNTLLALTFTLSQLYIFPIYAQSEEPVEESIDENEDEASSAESLDIEILEESEAEDEEPTEKKEMETDDSFVEQKEEDEIEPLQDETETYKVSEQSEGISIEQMFPDPAFRNYILTILDKNKDGQLSQAEISAVTDLQFDASQGITNFTGIEVFTALETLSIKGCSVPLLDIHGLPKLTTLDCSDNQMDSLNLENCPSLITVQCQNNKLTSINLNKCSSLETLICVNNLLDTLDLSQVSTLQKLDCSNNNALTSLNLSGVALKYLYASSSPNLALNSLPSSLVLLDCSNNGFTTLNVGDLKNLQYLDCSLNQLTALNASGLTNLRELSCESNKLTSLNVSGLTYLKTLHCADNQLTALNVSGLKSLINLYCYGNQLTELNVSGLPSLAILDCSSNRLSNLNRTGSNALSNLYCANNQLTSLNMSGLAALQELNCANNKLTTLDVSGKQNLKYLFCESNLLTALNVSNCPALIGLDCHSNRLAALDFSASSTLIKYGSFNGTDQKIEVYNDPISIKTLNSAMNASQIYAVQNMVFDQQSGSFYNLAGTKNNPQSSYKYYCTNTKNNALSLDVFLIPDPTKTSIAKASVSGINMTYSYTGKAIVPVPTVTLNGKTLTNNTDYTLAYSSNTNAGTAKITITGKGNYAGMIIKTFTIQVASLSNASISGLNASYTYTGKEIKPVPTITLNGRTLINNTDYTLTYSSNTNAGTARITITGKGNYFGSIIKSYTINKGALSSASISGVNASYTYTGKEIKPTPTITLNGKTLVNNTDYTLAYASNINTGTAKITITGKGNYSGTVTKTFAINKGALSSASISGVNASYTYTGKEIKPVPTLTLNGKTLVNNTDYTLAYASNINAGTAKITITGKGNYSGTVTKTFTIVASSVKMYRLYNPNSGEHFYTKNAAEKDSLVKVGWKYEGIGWTAPSQSNTPVYRLYNPNAGDHHYTSNVNEKNALVKVGWKYEGIGWYSDDAKGVPLYRQYNPNAKAGSHNYTTSKAENDSLIKVGWKGEGIGWYGLK